MIAFLALSAQAEPPRAEVLAGWSSNTAADFGYFTLQPTLFGAGRWRVMAKGTVSLLRGNWLEDDQEVRLDAPGVAFGPGVSFSPRDLSVGLGLMVGGRRSSTRVEDTVRDATIALDGALNGEVFWRPGQRAQLYTQFALGAPSRSIWARLGATVPVTPRHLPASLWLGLEGTGAGTWDGVATEVGPVAEIPVGPLRASFGLRAATPVTELAAGRWWSSRTTVGAAVYWAY